MTAWLRLGLIVVGCFLLGLVISEILFVAWLHAPASHVIHALRYFLISGIVSLGIGVVTVLLASQYAPTLGIKIAVASIAGSVAAIINVAITPLLMFSERSDVTILVITLLYFLAISLAFASVVAFITSRQIGALRAGAARVASGEFDARVEIVGSDEVADLARMFNHMSSQLGESFAQRHQLEQERGNLIASVSHDLRTPLSSIRAMVEALIDGVVTDPKAIDRYHALIQKESVHLGRLIDDLFELARIESGTFELHLAPVPLSELVAETVDGLQIHAQEKGVELHTTSDQSVKPLLLDGPQIQRVLVNLVQNALRHTPSGGQVNVEVRRVDGHVRLAVSDTGEGIAPEDRDRIFERFYRGEKSRSRESGGSGLGLAIARGIIQAHHGTIAVESTPGRETRFIVTL